MPNTQNKEESELPDWHSEKQSPETKLAWSQSVPDYLAWLDEPITKVVFAKSLVKEVLPFVRKHDTRWKGFKFVDFNTGQYSAHD